MRTARRWAQSVALPPPFPSFSRSHVAVPPRLPSSFLDQPRRVVSSSEDSDNASEPETRTPNRSKVAVDSADDYSEDDDAAADDVAAVAGDAAAAAANGSALQREPVVSSSDEDLENEGSNDDDGDDAEYGAEHAPSAKRSKKEEDPAERERRLALAREKKAAKAERDAQRRAERARERETQEAETARAKKAQRAAAQAEAARKRHATAALLEHYNAVRATALAEALPPVLPETADDARRASAGATLRETLCAMDAEDVEAALVALDDLHAHAKQHGTAWQGGNALLTGAEDLGRCRAYFPSLLRACHRGMATPAALALLERPPPSADAAGAAAPAELRPHRSGAARAEGYYFVTASEKKDKLAAGRQEQPTTKRSKALVREPSRNNRREARQLASALAAEDLDNVAAEMVRLNALKVRRRHLRFGRSRIHEWGLFAMEDIPSNAMVIEYVGEVIRQSVADDRERRYTDLGIGSSYLFRIDEQKIIDATRCGAIARFMNHSCDPNCYAQVVQVEGDPRIVIYSKRAIASGTEITYDYKFPLEDEKIPCHCGAANCRGTLN